MKFTLLFPAALLALHTAAHAGLERRRLSSPFSAPPLMGVSSVTLSPDSTTAAFRANATEVLRPDYFLVPLTGGTVVAANADATPSTGGTLHSTEPGGLFSGTGSMFFSRATVTQTSADRDVVQTAGLSRAATNLRVESTGSLGVLLQWPGREGISYFSLSRLVYQTADMTGPNLLSTSGVTVTDALFSPDGSRVIYSGTGGSVAREAVYSAKLSDDSVLTTVALSTAPVIGGGITDFKISANSSVAVIRGNFTSTTGDELYARPLDGTGSFTALVSAPAAVTQYAITPDGTRVVYVRGTSPAELYTKPVTGGTAVKLNATLPASAGGVSAFTITADSQRVVYLADQTTAGRSELFSTALDGTGNTKLNAALGIPAAKVTHFQLTPDGSKAVYRADTAAFLRFELFQVPVTGGAAARLHAPLTVTRSVEADFAVPANHHAVFRGDLDGLAGHTRLYAVPLSGNTPVRLDANTLADGDVTAFQVTADGAKVAYLADTETDGSMELHAAWGAPEVSALPDRWGAVNMPLTAVPFLLSDIETPAALLTVSAVSSNQALLPDSGLTVAGSGESRTLSFAPVAGVTGSAVVTLTISDGVHSTVRTLRITRYSTGYWAWLVEQFTLPVITNGALKSSTWGPYADPDGDGRANFEEYAYNTSPKNSADALNPLTLSLAAGARVHASHLIRTSEPLLTYSLEAGTSLTAFDSTTAAVEAAPVSLIAESASYSRLTRRLTKSTANAPAQFARLKVAWTSGE